MTSPTAIRRTSSGRQGLDRSSLVTAPVTEGVSFLLPAWFGDRSVPRSAIAPYAEGAIRIEAKAFTVGDASEPEWSAPVEPEDEDAHLPQPVWGSRQSSHREPSSDEVEAHKVLLSGDLAMWLDDGDRILRTDRANRPASASSTPKWQSSEPVRISSGRALPSEERCTRQRLPTSASEAEQ